jgi:N-carbamoylputrescine amidase
MSQSQVVTLAAIQCELGNEVKINLKRVSDLVEQAARQGGHIILIPELFQGPYFCKQEDPKFFEQARPAKGHPIIEQMQALARQHQVVLPVSFFEKDGPHYYNSVAMVDADGSMLGIYRKSHIPDGPGYEEKYYFRPGNTGFKVWDTRYARVGVGICWDQWFPEAARAMTLQGADLLLYPTAIGSEPAAPHLDTKDQWQRAMIGHAVVNIIPVVAANRIGNEDGQIFYGSSFIANHCGEKLAEMNRTESGVICAQINLQAVHSDRAAFGFFRDRRPELYGALVER